VAVYSGSGAWTYDNVALPNLFEWMDCSVTTVSGYDIKSGCLDNFDVLAWPGGDYLKYWEMGQEGKSIIQDFISGGGGYMGICAGAYYACDFMVWYADWNVQPYKVEGDELDLDLFPGVAHGPIDEIADWNSPEWYNMTKIKINHTHPITDSLPDYMQIFYGGGPFLIPYEDANVTILGTYDVTTQYYDVTTQYYPSNVTAPPAMVAFEYGNGRVFLTGPHPEIEEDSDRDGWPPELELSDEGSDWTLLLEAVKWLARVDIEESVQTATGSGSASFRPDSGMLEGLTAIDEANLPTPGRPDLLFSHGFFSFNVTGLVEGQTMTVTIAFPSNMPVGTQYWKCQDGTWSQIPVGDDDGDEVITITLADGGLGDADGVANGIITVDPGGVGYKLSTERVEGWAAILEMNNFPEGWSSCPSLDFMNSEMMSHALIELGWQSDHIYVRRDNLTIPVVEESVEWLMENSDVNDIALLYIFTHGMWMHWELLWNEWFPTIWEQVNTSKRTLMIDTCHAGEFIEPIYDDPKPHISLAHCSADEVAWAGLPEEGLPILGSIWNYYFTNALCNSTADFDENGFVSVEEAFNFSTPLVQTYMNETVFTVPEFLQSYHDIDIYPENYDAYPHPVMDDQYPDELHLDLRYYIMISDLNRDGTVNIQDIFIVAKAFQTKPGDEHWNEIADVDKNGIVNIIDLYTVARDYGKIV